MFDADYLKKNLDFEDYIFFESIDSTNEFLTDFIKRKKTSALAASVIQTQGRGRFDRKWSSAEGGLYFSFTQKAGDLDYNLQLFPIVCAMGVHSFLKSSGLPLLSYRWPNDILVKDKKISGILLEMIDDIIIAGIGININVKEFSEELNKTATSMFLIKRIKYDLSISLAEIIKNIKNVKTEKEILDFLENSSMKGKKVRFASSGRKVEGRVAGFKNTGEIEIIINGKVESFIAGDVSILREED